MLREKVLLLTAVISSQVCEVLAQENLNWIDSVVEYKFAGPTDSLRLIKESNYCLEEDTSTHIHINSHWDSGMDTWMNDFKSVGIHDQTDSVLEVQERRLL